MAIVSTRPQPTMKWSLAIQNGTATLLPDDAAANCSRLLRGLPAQHKLAVRIIEGRKEMIQQIGPDDAVDALDAKVLRELAQGKRCNGQVLDGPVADGE